MKILDEQEQLREDRASLQTDSPDISVFLPVFNEEPNLLPLHAKLDEALKSLGRSAEIVYVDDGSSDGSLKILREIAELDPRVRVVALRRNYGQTAAMAAGIDAAKGKVLIPMDADLQNDPADIRPREGQRPGRGEAPGRAGAQLEHGREAGPALPPELHQDGATGVGLEGP